MIVVAESHLDHGLSPEVVRYLLNRLADRAAFFVETIELPEWASVSCALHGPSVDDAPVPEAECRRVVRGGRAGASRVCDRPPRRTRLLTVVAGPHGDHPCVLYTAYGGPAAPREPWDPSLADDPVALAESRAFWAEHALSSD